jgi:hypothetical protein
MVPPFMCSFCCSWNCWPSQFKLSFHNSVVIKGGTMTFDAENPGPITDLKMWVMLITEYLVVFVRWRPAINVLSYHLIFTWHRWIFFVLTNIHAISNQL